ncbi:hypothetical protein B0H15DRAFT_796180 [Mycena belliarum]|uniref:Uncharacterized protein n=1 Tax=Mycena belliarum TaxID=1033014 RepID=A0AAD6XWN4_9AGAR|nr:hypothetical protein B0H15DRAFT_796180 [Mycena belliae]
MGGHHLYRAGINIGIPITREEALSGNAFAAYSGSKKFAELALWEWAEKHPHVQVTTTCATALSRLAIRFPPSTMYTLLVSNTVYLGFLFPDGSFPTYLPHLDIRDVARAHIGALSSAPTAEVGRKHMVFSSPHGWQVDMIVVYIAEQRPELKSRLLTAPPPGPSPLVALPMDFGRLDKVLGMKAADFNAIEAVSMRAALRDIPDLLNKTSPLLSL